MFANGDYVGELRTWVDGIAPQRMLRFANLTHGVQESKPFSSILLAGLNNANPGGPQEVSWLWQNRFSCSWFGLDGVQFGDNNRICIFWGGGYIGVTSSPKDENLGCINVYRT